MVSETSKRELDYLHDWFPSSEEENYDDAQLEVDPITGFIVNWGKPIDKVPSPKQD